MALALWPAALCETFADRGLGRVSMHSELAALAKDTNFANCWHARVFGGRTEG